MKKNLTSSSYTKALGPCIVLLLMINANAFSQWQTIFYPNVNQFPIVNATSFSDANNGLAVGPLYKNSTSEALILRTSDKGNSWDSTFISYPDSVSFEDVVHTGTSTAFAVGGSGNQKGIIASTIDGGLTWSTLTKGTTLVSASFPSSSIGYVCGYDGEVFKTIDGGATWDSLNTGFGSHHIFFVNDSVGFVCGDTAIVKTTDGGLSWNISYGYQNGGSLFGGIQKVFFPSANVGYAFTLGGGSPSKLIKTINQGLSWSYITDLDNGLGVYSIFFTDDNTGYMTGIFQLKKTTDGGLTWNMETPSAPSSPDFYDNLYDIFFVDANTGFAAGLGQFYRTPLDTNSTASVAGLPTSNSVSVYPNPSGGLFTLSLTGVTVVDELVVTDVYGKTIYRKSFAGISTGSLSIDLGDVAKGIYFARLQGKDQTTTQKLVIK